MTHRLIVCLDPARLLRPPCPALFPEWDHELLVVGPGMTTEAWARVASAIAAADCDRVPVAVWQLLDLEQWNERDSVIEELSASAPVGLRARLGGDPLRVIWVDPPDEELRTHEAAVVLRTRFEGAQPAEASLALRRLVPLGIRVLLDRALLLGAFDHPTHEIAAVTIVAERDALLEAERDWACRLTAAEQELSITIEQLGKQPCTEPLLDPNGFASLSVGFDPGLPQELPLSLFQVRHEDDREITEWLESERGRLGKAIEKHHEELRKEFREKIASLARAKPGPASGGETRSCAKVREDIEGELAKLGGPAAGAELPVLPRRAAEAWYSTHRDAVLLAARRRVTARLCGAVTGSSLLAFALAGTIGFDLGAPGPGRWADLLPIGVAGSLLILGALAMAAWYRASAQSAVRAARDGLAESSEKLRKAAEEATRYGARCLERMVLSRNLAAMERACEEQRLGVAKGRAHVAAIERLRKTVEQKTPHEPRGASSVPNFEQPPEHVAAYWWSASAGARPVDVHFAMHRLDPGPSPELHPVLQRYTGVRRIEIS